MAGLFAAASLLSACRSSQPTSSSESSTESKNKSTAASATVQGELAPYQGSRPIEFDLTDTKLDVSFDWQKSRMNGLAVLSFKVHFYAQNKLVLDARGMEISDVKLIRENDSLKLAYQYENDKLTVQLDRNYLRDEKIKVFIRYQARPEELNKIGGSAAITSDKGLYFINPKKEIPEKPRQVWTQGETQSNSVWFPTLDAPNQKMTQEIRITVDSSLVTLSNGLLVKSERNQDGTRSDTWKQKVPHAPYLAMMAVSDFAVVKDVWRQREVSYYVDKPYEKYAREIFANTSEMLDFYSRIFGVEYPWEKYAQVVVRDYVSGAMENSSATIFGEWAQATSREMIDQSAEGTVAHELVHHWFGDLVTCESWANIPLNESFATYGSYLWDEYKYGRDVADERLSDNLGAYLRESKIKKVDLIRFDYKNQEEMFDRHSYQKGSRVLHMLRNYTGNEAFFASLKKYLEDNRFGTAEIHDLRLAFESVTGKDMNWFFNQWFLDHGHPVLDISYLYDEALKQSLVHVQQKQKVGEGPLYRLPVAIDVYEKQSVKRHTVEIISADTVFRIPASSKPELVNFDADKMLLCEKTDAHTEEEWAVMYRRAPLFMDRYEAVQALMKNYTENSPGAAIVKEALADKNPRLREAAIGNCGVLMKSADSSDLRKTYTSLIQKDPKSSVRAAALQSLNSVMPAETQKPLYAAALKDSSYRVVEAALQGLAKIDPATALGQAKSFEPDKTERNINSLFRLYADYGNNEQAGYMAKNLAVEGHVRSEKISQYAKCLERCTDERTLENGITELFNIASKSPQRSARMNSVKSLKSLSPKFIEKSGLSSDSQAAQMYQRLSEKCEKYLNGLKTTETDPQIKKILEEVKG